MKEMKLGISYNLFDGEELLESSIRAIRSEAFYVSVVYQTKSYYGNLADNNIENYLKSLIEKGLIDEIYHYDKGFSHKDKHHFEIQKRNIGLEISKKAGCSHYLSMDVDEFYDAKQLKKAKEYILRKNIKTSAVSIVEYLKEPIYKLVNSYTYTPDVPYNFYVPFIMKIHKISFKNQKHNKKWYPCVVDPTRALNNREKFYLFSVQDIVMHHMSTIRNDLNKKYNNSNFNLGDDKVLNKIRKLQDSILNWTFEENQISEKYSIFENKLVEKTENHFNINLKNK